MEVSTLTNTYGVAVTLSWSKNLDPNSPFSYSYSKGFIIPCPILKEESDGSNVVRSSPNLTGYGKRVTSQIARIPGVEVIYCDEKLSVVMNYFANKERVEQLIDIILNSFHDKEYIEQEIKNLKETLVKMHIEITTEEDKEKYFCWSVNRKIPFALTEFYPDETVLYSKRSEKNPEIVNGILSIAGVLNVSLSMESIYITPNKGITFETLQDPIFHKFIKCLDLYPSFPI